MPPAGFKRSRALWQRDDDSMAYYGSSAFRNAVIYELQPLRWSEWKSQQDLMAQQLQSLLRTLKATMSRLPTIIASVWKWLKYRSVRQWLVFFAALLYYAAVRYIHYKLEAGPIIMIVTALVAIFTVGLSDNRNDGLPSAYSIFNRGFASLMGSLDADALVQQHIGGGFMGAAAGAMAPPPPLPIVENRPVERRGADQAQRPERLPENQQPNDEVRVDENPRGAARRPRKKQVNRRSTVEHRRDIQRQREAAEALGFGGVDEDIAMNRLIEDQVQ
jgi:Uncharacterized conserved domain (SAYSvFN)